MKKLLLLALLFSQSVYCQEAGIKLAVNSFFEAFHARDSISLQRHVSDKMLLHSVSGKPTPRLTEESGAMFIKAICSIPDNVKFEERLLSYNIQYDDDLAHVWTPYEFYVNGVLSHKGVNSIQLFKDAGAWKIIYIVDTRQY